MNLLGWVTIPPCCEGLVQCVSLRDVLLESHLLFILLFKNDIQYLVVFDQVLLNVYIFEPHAPLLLTKQFFEGFENNYVKYQHNN